jgi:hypothetical protein
MLLFDADILDPEFAYQMKIVCIMNSLCRRLFGASLRSQVSCCLQRKRSGFSEKLDPSISKYANIPRKKSQGGTLFFDRFRRQIYVRIELEMRLLLIKSRCASSFVISLHVTQTERIINPRAVLI